MFCLFDKTSAGCSKLITENYSTSFSLGIKTLHKKFHEPIYGIYAMVRYADEIVDTFHDFDKAYLLAQFRKETFEAIQTGISLNPVLFSFQKAVRLYNIPLHLVEAFFNSMETDLCKNVHGKESYEEYIYGSAEVVGLMCLKVFSENDNALYENLKTPARALGAAFQKVNFLRDMKSDYDERGRTYFPAIDFNNFMESAKEGIEAEIEEDFIIAMKGIALLPREAQGGVMLACNYYWKLFMKIRKVPASKIKEERIRVHDLQKAFLLVTTLLRQKAGDFSLSY